MICGAVYESSVLSAAAPASLAETAKDEQMRQMEPIMKLSLSGRIFEGGPAMPAPAFVRMAKQAGYDMVELRASQVPADSTGDALASIKAALDETGLDVSMLVIGPAKDATKWLPIARALGSRNLRASGSSAELLAACKQIDPCMRIVYQMHSGSLFEDVVTTVRTLAEIPDDRFGVMPEPANLMFAGERWHRDLLLPLRGRIYGCNAQSIVLRAGAESRLRMNNGREVRYGRMDWPENDQIDLPGFVAALQAAGYRDFINFIDPCPKGRSVSEFAAQTAAFARQALAGVAG
jgi:sugar phosphate isomerase/epimerase